MATTRAPEVAQLLGAAPRQPQVRRLVADLAVAALAELVRSEAALVAHRSAASGAISLATLAAEALDPADPVGLELAGRLWQALDVDPPASPGGEAGPPPGEAVEAVHEVGDRHLWVARVATGDGIVGAALLRDRPFEPGERALLARLVSSVGVAVGGIGAQLPAGTHLRTLSEATDRAYRAEVVVSMRGTQLRGVARADDAVTAAATATASLFGEGLGVRLAGQVPVDDVTVTVVVVVADRSPVIGLSITPPGSTTGPAEAVLSAVRALWGDPLQLLQGRASASS